MKRANLILGLAMLLCAASSAQAGTIYYTVSAAGVNGTLGATRLHDATVTISFQSSSAPVHSVETLTWLQLVTATYTVTMGGALEGSGSFAAPVVAFDCQPPRPVGCSEGIAGIGVPVVDPTGAPSKVDWPILGVINPTLGTYNLNADLAPVLGGAYWTPNVSDGGLVINEVTGGACFDASTSGFVPCTPGGPTPTPEASSLILMGTALVSLIGLARLHSS